jgi:prepilin signal peptidase PulO-like enzyme (type II secretory pathway)
LGLVALIDLEHRVILLSLSLAGILLGTIAGVWIQWQRAGNVGQALLSTLLGGVSGFLMMFLLYHLGALLARWMARQRGETLEEEALGFGDVHLGLILGLILGWPVIFFGLTTGIIFGGVASLFYLLVKVITGRHRLFTAIPYGPYLIAGAVFLLYFNNLFTSR